MANQNLFVVTFVVDKIVYEFNSDTGLLSCSIPKQSTPDVENFSVGIVSQQAVVSVQDIDMKIRDLVVKKAFKSKVPARIYYNDNIIFYGFINDSNYSEDSSIFEFKIADPIILLSDITIKNEVSTYFDICYITKSVCEQVEQYLSNMGLQIKFSLDGSFYDYISKFYVEAQPFIKRKRLAGEVYNAKIMDTMSYSVLGNLNAYDFLKNLCELVGANVYFNKDAIIIKGVL